MRRLLPLLLLLALVPALAGAQTDALCPEPATGAARGGEGADTLTGTEQDDRIDGGGGGDRIDGLGGRDCLTGGDGGDTIDGGDGADAISGDTEGARAGSADDLRGGPGADVLDGGGGDDVVDGGGDGDRLRGGFGDDALAGGDGDDHLDGVTGVDRLDGGEGGDRLVAEAGTVAGGGGDDSIEGADLAVDAGSGDDLVRLRPGRSRVTLGDGDDVARTADGIAGPVACGPGTDTVVADRRDRLSDCERVTRREMPDPRLVRRTGDPRTTFRLTFASPLDYDAEAAEGEDLSARVVAGPAPRCRGIDYEVPHATRRGARELVRLTPPRGRWCPGRYRVQLVYETFSISSSCDSGDLGDEDCRSGSAPIGESLTFRVR